MVQSLLIQKIRQVVFVGFSQTWQIQYYKNFHVQKINLESKLLKSTTTKCEIKEIKPLFKKEFRLKQKIRHIFLLPLM